MSIDNLKSSLPEFAKDLKLNLSSLSRSTVLNEQQLWGSMLAAAAATRNEAVLNEIAEEATSHLSEQAVNAAYAAASIMAMNNVAYRAKGWLGDDYAPIKFGLRMNVINGHGIEKADFELFNIAVSVINGCEHCTVAHEKTVLAEGMTREQVWEAIKVAATVQGVAQAVFIDATR